MKTKIIFILVFLSLIAISSISKYTFQGDSGPHGGRVERADDYHIEVAVSKPNIFVYLLDKKMIPISNKGVTCEMRFFFYDNTDCDVKLKAFGEDGFSLESSLSGYHSYRVIFYMFGKQITAKFVEENYIVHK